MTQLSENLRYLRKKQGLTQGEFAKKIEVNRPMIGAYEEERASPKLAILQKMAICFDVSVDELINSDLTKRELSWKTVANPVKSEKEFRVLTTIVNSQNKEQIVVVPAKASAGYLNGYADSEYIESLPRFELPLPELYKERTYRAFQIIGDSMLPILSGSYIISEYLQNWHDVKEGKAYIVITNSDGIVYKRIFKQSSDILLLKSDNTEYEPYTVDITDITEIWKAVGVISLTLPEPESVNINQLSNMVLEMKKELAEMKKNN